MSFEDDFADIFADTETIEPIYKDVESAPLTVSLDGEVHQIKPEEPHFPPALEYLNSISAVGIIEAEIASTRSKRLELEGQIETLKREYSVKLIELNGQLEPLQTEAFDLQRKKRLAEQAVAAAEQRLRDAILALRHRAMYKEASLKFDELTAGFKWREWALNHQLEGARMLAIAQRAILGDGMGLGKTLTSQITADMLQSQKMLVIVPDDVVENFLREINHWAPHRMPVLLGKMTKNQRNTIIGVLRNMPAFTVVVNYSAWRKDSSLLDKLIELRFDTIIMDEAHTVKNTRTNAFKGCEKIVLAENACPECSGAIQHVHYSGDVSYAAVGGRYLPRDYFVCNGDQHVVEKTLDAEVFTATGGCGWSGRNDADKDIKRPYGALRSIKNVFPMTGTPILNKPNDLFALLKLIDDEHYASEAAFLRDYCKPHPFRAGQYVFRPGGLESLTKRLAGKYIARNRKSAGVVLPKQDVIIHNIELDKTTYAAQARVIEQLSKHSMILLDNGKSLPIFAYIALITRKRQANVWPAGIEIKDPETDIIVFSVGDEVRESIKLDKIIMEPQFTESGEYEGLVPDYVGLGPDGPDRTNGDRVVIFSQFKGPLAELENRMKAAGIDVVRFDGDTPERLRDEIKLDFDRKYAHETDYKWQVVLCNYKTGGVGLNLNAAVRTIILDEEWNAGKRDQAYARTDRMGQTEENTVDVLRLDKTIDTWLANLIDSKQDLVAGFESNAEMANSMLEAMRNGEMM